MLHNGKAGVAIFYEDGIAEVLNYGYLMRTILPDDGKIVIYSTEGVYVVDGRYLSPLLTHLKNQEIDTIRAFNPQCHIEPPEHETKIFQIEYFTLQEWHEKWEHTVNLVDREALNSDDSGSDVIV